MPTPPSLIEQQVHDALDLRAEVVGVEFKESQPLDVLKYKLTKATMAMANTRDGGLIIIGVGQREDGPFTLDGVDEATRDTYDHETIYDFVNDYASPAIELLLLHITHAQKHFVAIAVAPSERSPVICRRSTPDNSGLRSPDQMHTCEIYVRTGAPVASKRASSAAMLEDLLQAAAARRAAEMIRVMRAAGAFEEIPQRPNRFDQEIGDLADFF